MLSKDFYLANIKKFRSDFGWNELLRLKSIDQLDLRLLGEALELPSEWMKISEDWYERQSKRSEVIWCFHDKYPEELYKLENPPMFLFVEGCFEIQKFPRIAMVGAREVSLDVLSWMDLEVTKFLNKAPHVVVSGGARGVDQKAHFLALRSGCPTWVLLPSGLDHLYPRTWGGLKKDFLDSGGCFITEYPLGVEMRAHHFVRRNQLIVALSQTCFILQAARRSGTYLTAQMAQKSGLPLAALSHFSGLNRGLGCLDLICDGASLIRDHKDLLAWTGLVSRAP